MTEPETPDTSDDSRLVMVSVRPSEMKNLQLFLQLREEEHKAMEYLLQNFSKDDLTVLNGSLENLRVMRRAGHFAFWLLGFVGAGAAAAAYIKGWLWK
jgi:hypothetical protein